MSDEKVLTKTEYWIIEATDDGPPSNVVDGPYKDLSSALQEVISVECSNLWFIYSSTGR